MLIYRFLEDKKLTAKLDMPEFTELYDKFKKSAVQRISNGVRGMLDTWLSYCSSKQKEIADKCYQKMDSVRKLLYVKAGKAISML